LGGKTEKLGKRKAESRWQRLIPESIIEAGRPYWTGPIVEQLISGPEKTGGGEEEDNGKRSTPERISLALGVGNRRTSTGETGWGIKKTSEGSLAFLDKVSDIGKIPDGIRTNGY